MKISYNWLKSLIKGSVSEPEELIELLTMHSFEIEEVIKKRNDFILDIDVLPNRAPDCLSHYGIAREVVAIMKSKGKKVELEELDTDFKKESDISTEDSIKLEVENKNDCSRYTLKLIDGVEVKDSPDFIKKRLEACGLQPINNIVDIANYVMLETGQPLHAFDLEKVEGSKILVRRAQKREKINTLDDKEYDLDGEVLIIADKKKPLAVAGIKGGREAGITENTSNIILESANFNSHVIRKASRELKLKTDASWRFENSIDPNLTEKAIKRTANLIQEHAGGKASKDIADFYPEKRTSNTIELRFDYVRKLLGVQIENSEIIKSLENLELKTEKPNPETIEVEVPTFRLDLKIPEDLIEEVGRLYEFGKIPSELPELVLAPPERNESVHWRNNVRDALKNLGFFEAYNYSFISEKQLEAFNFKDVIELENPASKKRKYLRPSLIPNLLENVKYNRDVLESAARGNMEIKIFEVGKTFSKKNGKVSEKELIAGLLLGENSIEENFYQIKGNLDTLLQRLGLSSIWYDDYEPTPEESEINLWHRGQCAEIKVGEEEIGFLGVISPFLLRKINLEGPVIAFTLNFEKLKELSTEEEEYAPVSTFPAAVRDLAVLVPLGIKTADVLNEINRIGGSLIRDIDLFDIYEGEEIPDGRKNLAFHIIYQAEDRTLESEEIDEIQEKIVKGLEENPDWEVRR